MFYFCLKASMNCLLPLSPPPTPASDNIALTTFNLTSNPMTCVWGFYLWKGSSFCTNFCTVQRGLATFDFHPHSLRYRLRGSLCSLLLSKHSGWSGNYHLEHYWLSCQESQRVLVGAPTEWVIKYSSQFTMYWPKLVTWLHQSPRKHKSLMQHLPGMG